ncbi:MAG: hypothetical protein QOJ27_2423 [Sphingomonadales bacterium]|nr:hypothetical protein [Sphingomonadales bacterium]
MTGRLVIAIALAAAPVAFAPAAAAMADDTVMAPLFAQACGGATPTAEAIEARMNADGAWRRLKDTDLAVEALARVKPGVPSGPFKSPGPYKQWLRTVDGKEVRLLLATYEGRYKHLCALLVPDVANAMPYLDGFDDALKAMGLKGHNTDLPHFREYHGKLSDGRRAWGEIFSRSHVLLGPGHNMHMYVAF